MNGEAEHMPAPAEVPRPTESASEASAKPVDATDEADQDAPDEGEGLPAGVATEADPMRAELDSPAAPIDEWVGAGDPERAPAVVELSELEAPPEGPVAPGPTHPEGDDVGAASVSEADQWEPHPWAPDQVVTVPQSESEALSDPQSEVMPDLESSAGSAQPAEAKGGDVAPDVGPADGLVSSSSVGSAEQTDVSPEPLSSGQGGWDLAREMDRLDGGGGVAPDDAASPSATASGPQSDSPRDRIPTDDVRLEAVWDSSAPTDAGRAFYTESDPMRSQAEMVAPREGVYTVDLHGSPDYTVAGTSGGDVSLSPADLGSIIRSDPNWQGEPIRLLSCSTGQIPASGDDPFAQQLSDNMGVEVSAPNGPAFNDAEGKVFSLEGAQVDAFGAPLPGADLTPDTSWPWCLPSWSVN
jgi:hypothetical protein